MEKILKNLLPAVSAVLISILSYYFVEGWYNVFPWAIAALLVGYMSKNRRGSLINGAVFGYVLFFVYIFAGYKGKTDAGSMVKFIAFNILFSLVGSVACAVGAFMGNWIKRKFK